MLEMLLRIMTMILTFGNLCIMLYALRTFLLKPRNSILERLLAVEIKLKEHDDSLHKGNDKFRMQDQTNEVLLRSSLALVEFEMQYCLTENKAPSKGLEAAKEHLDEYLSSLSHNR